MTRCAGCKQLFQLRDDVVAWFRANCPQWLGDPWWCDDCTKKAGW